MAAPSIFEISIPSPERPLFAGDPLDCDVVIRTGPENPSSKEPVIVSLLKNKASYGSWSAEEQPSEEPGLRKLRARIKLPDMPDTYRLTAKLFHTGKAVPDQEFKSEEMALVVKPKK